MIIIINYAASPIKRSDGMAEVPERDYGMSYRPAGTFKAVGGSNDGYAGFHPTFARGVATTTYVSLSNSAIISVSKLAGFTT